MLSILRQMSGEELRYAAAACGAGADVTPDGIIRALCRECGILGWGFVPLSREDALLEQMAQRMGVADTPKGPKGVPLMERRVFSTLVRRAWEAAGPEYQRTLLQSAASAWDADATALPRLPLHDDRASLGAALDNFLLRPSGLRALASATEAVPLILPPVDPGPIPQQIGTAVGNLTGIRPRPDRGHHALFEVLKICWRTRRRLLLDRKAHQQHLQRQMNQLRTNLEQRVTDLRGAAAPWARHRIRGLTVAGGALAATSLQWLMLDVSNPIGWVAIAGGLAWTAATTMATPRLEEDPRYSRLQTELAATRQQLAAVQQSILALEAS